MTLFTFKNLAFSLKCYAAAMIALVVAFSADLPNPWWAAVTVYITSQPFAAVSGAVWSRALYRALGSVGGVAAMVVIIPNLVDTPELMLAAISLWVALCLYVSLLDRSPRSYGFMLAGYSAALVGLPLTADPSHIFETAIGRTEEILLGVLCAALVQTLFFPQSAVGLLRAKLTATMVDAKGWILGALGQDGTGEKAARRKLATDLTELNGLAKVVSFERSTSGTTDRVVWALEERLVEVLPLLSGVEDRIKVLAEAASLPDALATVVAEVRLWIASGGGDVHGGRGAALERACLSTAPVLLAESTWEEILAFNLAHRLAELVAAWDRSVKLSADVVAPAALSRPGAIASSVQARSRPLHVDHGMAAFSGLAAGLAVLVSCGFAMAIGWASGAVAGGIAAAASSVFAFADDPTPFQKLFAWVAIACVPVAALYQFAIFPFLDGFTILAVALFPLFMITGLALASPKYWLHGLVFALMTQTLISLQVNAVADFVNFANAGAAVVLGAFVALLVTMATRVISVEVAARRILRAGWRDLERLSTGLPATSRRAWASRMLDRQGLLLPRLARAKGDESLSIADALNDLRVGVNVIDLRDCASELQGASRAAVDRLLSQLGRYFRSRRRHGRALPSSRLLGALDDSMSAMLNSPATASRSQGLVASAGLRRGLFPSSAGYSASKGQP